MSHIDVNTLEELTENLQSGFKRDSNHYRNAVKKVADTLNAYGRGCITSIDVDELRDQIGHLLYYDIKGAEHPYPFDVEHVPPLLSHIKNPTIIVLRRIRRYLMAGHRKILAKLEEEQAQERRLGFRDLDVNGQIRKGLDEMQRFQTLAQLAKTTTRKLDLLAKALHVPAHTHANFQIISRLLADPHHLRHHEAKSWLNDSSYKGNTKLVKGLMDKGLGLLDEKGQDIFDIMEKLSGIPFDRNTQDLDSSFNWYSLGTPLRRGEEFVRIFENEEQTERRIKRLTFFLIRATWDADQLRERMEASRPNLRELQDNSTKLSRLYFELEQKISESTKTDGDALTAIRSDFESKQLNEREAEEAKEWVRDNKTKLQKLKLDLIHLLAETKADHQDVALPEKLEALLPDTGEQVPFSERPPVPKISIFDLNRDLELIEPRLAHPDADLLADLIALKEKLVARREEINSVSLQKQLRQACPDFDQYEQKLLEFHEIAERIDEMRSNCDEWILMVYREVDYRTTEISVLEKAFEVVVDQMLQGIKTLDYSAIDAARFKEYLEHAISLADNHALHHLDWLLHEIHVIPRQDQLLNALADWESALGKSAYEDKQEWILGNEMDLQRLVDDVRAELRERIVEAEIKPRRLRFEVFSLSDNYAGNLRTLLEGLMRMAPFITSEQEGERLIASVQAIESQIIEAQRVTKPKGEAWLKLKEMERRNIFPEKVTSALNEDLSENFKDLNELLHRTNECLERLREVQNRFGGNHDTSHLTITINIHDLESLKQIYHFVDNITIMDMKRFGIVYKQRYALIDDIFDRAKNKDPDLPQDIAKAISNKMHKAYKENKALPIPLKTMIFKEFDDVLKFECQLLIRTLNFVSHSEVRNKAVYRGVLKLLEPVKEASIPKRRTLRRIWVKIRSAVLAYKPRNYAKNYQNNTRALITDARNLIGDKFEDL